MPADPKAVGTRLPDWTGTLDARWLMAYAAGLGHSADAYLDTTAGVVAHPVFPVAPEWALLTAGGTSLQALGLTQEESVRGVHASHDLQLEEPLRQDTRVVVSAEVVGVQASPAGAVVTQRFTGRADDGRVLWTTWMRSLFRGVGVDGPDAVAAASPGAPAAPEPRDVRRREIALAAGAPHVYTECARIWNPIHTDLAVARAAGLPALILHGTANLAHGVDWALEVLGAGPAAVSRLGGEFRAMVQVPSVLTCEVTAVTEEPGGRTAHFAVRNAEGRAAVRSGFVTVRD